MERTKTFIVGAGASAELGFPTGRQLVEKIEAAANFNFDDFGRFNSGDRVLVQAFERLPRADGQRWSLAGLANVATRIRANMGLAPSIDYFLDSKRDKEGWSEVGKLLIARCILTAERVSRLYFDRNKANAAPGFADLPLNWLSELFRILTARSGLDGFREGLRSCRFITFNYDRTIEQFFHQAIKSYFDLGPHEVDQVCTEDLMVAHVYGSLGEVNCVQPGGYGNSEDPHFLIEAAQSISTFTESIEDDDNTERVREWIKSSDVVAFLGFGFLPLNLKAIFANTNYAGKGKILGTVYGIPEENLSIAKNVLLSHWAQVNPVWLKFESVKCSELIWNHAYYLGAPLKIAPILTAV